VHCTINAIGVFVKFLQHAIVFRVRQQGRHRHPWEVIAPEALAGWSALRSTCFVIMVRKADARNQPACEIRNILGIPVDLI
jgi:hypothetical protein